jgi:hypothetical protein
MPEITEIITQKQKATQQFTPDTTGPLYVGITDEATIDTEVDNTDTWSTMRPGDNIFIIGAGISIPESFCLSTPDTVAGTKLPNINFYLYPDAPGFDPTLGLPANPKLGNIWESTATANGWTLSHIYRYNGVSWDDITTGDAAVYHHNLFPVLANQSGKFYIPFENFEYLLNTFIDVVNGIFYDATAAKYVTGIKLPYEPHLSIDHTTVRISMVNCPKPLNGIVQSITPFMKITHNQKMIDLASLNT